MIQTYLYASDKGKLLFYGSFTHTHIHTHVNGGNDLLDLPTPLCGNVKCNTYNEYYVAFASQVLKVPSFTDFPGNYSRASYQDSQPKISL